MFVSNITVLCSTQRVGQLLCNRIKILDPMLEFESKKRMEPPNYKSVIEQSQSPRSEVGRKGEGSLKLKSSRPRSRTGSGGILRLDITKPNLHELNQVDPPSPQPSIDRLSVTFAAEERSICSSDNSVKLNLYVPSTPPISCMEKVRFPTITDGEDSDDDYSASVTAIMQRRASTRKSRKKGRRTSSPFSHDQEGLQVRRRSSCFTTSSGDTAISMEESLPQEVTQEQIFENIRLHKEVLSSVKMQPWGMRRKIKLVQQAKSYIKRHQGVLQERLAQSRSTRDILARWNIYLVQKLQHYRRELANLSNLLIPWESRIKEIESHFGSVVASYFTFLRWLFWVNLIISVVLVAFVAIPELLTADTKSQDAEERKIILPEEKTKATNLLTLWDFEGVLKYSPLFYGFYTKSDGTAKWYRLPLAYFMTGLGVYVYSFVATLRKMAENSRMSKLSEKDDECVFTWKLFTGWDYMIGNAETAQNRVASIILGFKEALLEEAEKKREPRNWKIIGARVMVNFLVLILLGVSAFAVVEVVERSKQPEANSTFWRRNEITVVMSLISFIFPMLFEGLGFFEHYHPRKQLRLQLARIMVLNMLNLYSLIFALFMKIKTMTKDLEVLKNATIFYEPSNTSYTNLLTNLMQPNEECYEISIDCANVTSRPELSSASLITTVLTNLSMALYLSKINQTQEIFNNYTSTLNNIFGSTPSYENITDLQNYSIPNLYNFTLEPNIFYNTSEYNVSFPDSEYNITFPDSYGLESLSDLENDSFYDENATSTIDSTEVTSFLNLTTLEVLMSNNTTTEDYYYEDYNAIADYPSEVTAEIDRELLYNILKQLNMTDNLSDEDSDTNEINIEDILDNILPIINTTLEATNYSIELTTLINDLNATLITILMNRTDDKMKCKERKCVPKKNPDFTDIYQMDKKYLGKSNPAYNYTIRKQLRNLCWETMFGQELVKLTIMDLSFTIISILGVDFFRAISVRLLNNCFCWDLEKQFPQYGDFKIAENILHLVNNQGMVWMGMFFSPGITVLNLIKLAILMYLRSWAVLTCNVPHEVVFRASRSNNFYLALLLTMLFLCVLPVGYAIVWIQPSWHCGPFSDYERIYYIFTKSLKAALPEVLRQSLDYIASPFIVIPLLVLLILIIYYMISLTNALREANNDLKLQLRRERTEERRKMFQIADRRRRNGSGDSGDEATPFGKWKKLLPMLPNSKSFEGDVSSKENDADDKNEANKNKDFLVNFIKRAIKKPTNTSGDSNPQAANATDDATDTEQHESLPDDGNTREPKPEKKERVINNFRKILNARKQQTESQSDIKTVKIPKNTSSDSNKPNTNKKKFERLTSQDKYRSTSRSSSSKDLRQDSLTSNWSDNIPVIKIIGTGSSECILEQQNESSPPSQNNSVNRKSRKITHQDHIDIDNKSDDIPASELQIAEPQCASSSSDTLVTVKMEELELPIHDNQNINDDVKFVETERVTIKEKLSIDTDQSTEMQQSSNSTSTQTSQTKTESSTGYKEQLE